jgi:hypothetical protein
MTSKKEIVIGQAHAATAHHRSTQCRCARVKGLPSGGYLPIPLAAQGETLGMLPGVSALFRCDFFGSYNRSDGDPGTPGLGGGEAPVVGSISYGDLLVIDKTARPL